MQRYIFYFKNKRKVDKILVLNNKNGRFETPEFTEKPCRVHPTGLISLF